MNYYNARQTFLIRSSTIKAEKTKKIDKFLELLDKSGVCDLINEQVIRDERRKIGRPGYNVYNMLVAVLFGIGNAFDTIVFLGVYWFLLKNKHINILDVEINTQSVYNG